MTIENKLDTIPEGRLIHQAGYFDAKANIALIKGKKHRIIKITISHRTMDILKVYQDKWGGSIIHIGNSFVFQISTIQAAKMLEELLPYMVLKNDISKTVLEYRKLDGYVSEGADEIREGLYNDFNMYMAILNEGNR